ncbi:unnamed protein product [Ceratitis capitata]|uniref:(Mediterranean fruit fly) hypothetical protein n=1 Tax=Ceratitis capitata TaxID=7213 RepID=A0A811U1M4_CERCA|nr:unnamed protein product [Ceratitis capitata]
MLKFVYSFENPLHENNTDYLVKIDSLKNPATADEEPEWFTSFQEDKLEDSTKRKLCWPCLQTVTGAVRHERICSIPYLKVGLILLQSRNLVSSTVRIEWLWKFMVNLR